MALFTRKSKTEVTKPTPEPQSSQVTVSPTLRSLGGAGELAHVLRNPRITEKASSHMGVGVYAFDVAERATKRSIMQAVYALYNVRPRSVHVVTVPRKVRRSTRTGKRGMTGGGKKAYVYLKKGDSITLA